jgi:hypothetical protein
VPSPTAAAEGPAPLERVAPGSGFNWREFALGAGAMLGLVVLLGGIVTTAVAMRSNRTHPSST